MEGKEGMDGADEKGVWRGDTVRDTTLASHSER